MISIIVPVFNVEAYIRRCLESLLQQTYRDIEVVIIDDGSTDLSGNICDEYAGKDYRFRVFHTLNRGLSAARNYGIDQAKGDWLMFLDSDDAVHRDFCLIPYQAAQKHNADLVIFQIACVVKEKTIFRSRKDLPIGLISKEKAIDYGNVAVWNKLYRKQLFEEIRFPEGIIFEDTAITHKIIYQAQRIAMIPDPLIFYYYRKDSISNSTTYHDIRNYFILNIRRCSELVRLGYPCEKAQRVLQSTAFQYCIRTEPRQDDLSVYAEKLVKDIQGFPKGFTRRKKLLLCVWRVNRNVFHSLCRLWKMKREGKISKRDMKSATL